MCFLLTFSACRRLLHRSLRRGRESKEQIRAPLTFSLRAPRGRRYNRSTPTPGPQHGCLLPPSPLPPHLFTNLASNKDILIKNLLTLPRTDFTQPRTTSHSTNISAPGGLSQKGSVCHCGFQLNPPHPVTDTNVSKCPSEGWLRPPHRPPPQRSSCPSFCTWNGSNRALGTRRRRRREGRGGRIVPPLPSMSFTGTKPKPEFERELGQFTKGRSQSRSGLRSLHQGRFTGGRLSGLRPWGAVGTPPNPRVTPRLPPAPAAPPSHPTRAGRTGAGRTTRS